MKELFERKQNLQNKNSHLYLQARKEIQNNLDLYKNAVLIYEQIDAKIYDTDWVFELPVQRLNSIIDTLGTNLYIHYEQIFFPKDKLRYFLTKEYSDERKIPFDCENALRLLYIYTVLRDKIRQKKDEFGTEKQSRNTQCIHTEVECFGPPTDTFHAEIDLINDIISLFSGSTFISRSKVDVHPWDIPDDLKVRYAAPFTLKLEVARFKRFELDHKLTFIEKFVSVMTNEDTNVYETLLSFKFNDRFRSLKFITNGCAMDGTAIRERVQKIEKVIFERFNDDYKSVLFLSYVIYVCPGLSSALSFEHLKENRYYYFLKWTEYL
ncbi:hypothetical protein THOM_0544 [Trachipleistophora hominis]|uniref:Uncharacterized protein n=1 Tax=Trachipleistophora hominis TaxID=72359 RepID=L7JZN7_TRAHO|nr:hypothetical protein THOM_0544 [Trachipleistophora hominis]